MSLNKDSQGEPDPQAFGARIRDAAGRLNYSPAELGRRANIAKQTLSAYWNGQRFCGAERLFVLAEALAVDPRWLVEGATGEAEGERAQQEAALIRAFRALDARSRNALVHVAQAMERGSG